MKPYLSGVSEPSDIRSGLFSVELITLSLYRSSQHKYHYYCGCFFFILFISSLRTNAPYVLLMTWNLCMGVQLCVQLSRLEYLFMYSFSGQSSSLLIKKHISFKILHKKTFKASGEWHCGFSTSVLQWESMMQCKSCVMCIYEYTGGNDNFQWAMLLSWHKFTTFVMSASISLTLSKVHQASQP